MSAAATRGDCAPDAAGKAATTTKARAGVVSVARDSVLEAVGQCAARVWLASPFLSRRVAQALVDRAPKGEAVSRRLLTALTQRAVEAGVLDPQAVALLQASGWEVRSIPNLHAKAVLCDDREALIGSANLTEGGLGGGNLELGIWLPAQDVDAVTSHLEHWWCAACPVAPSDLENASRDFPPGPGRSPGGVVGRPLRLQDGARLRAAQRLRQPQAGSLWVKAVYHEGRNASPDWWVDQRWINDAHGRTPKGRSDTHSRGSPRANPDTSSGIS
jgi:phosphatidylserine/phosphatidylglycerophosphate/cardiolipin synthase-like enzyme